MTAEAHRRAGLMPASPRASNQPRAGVRGVVLSSAWSREGVAAFEALGVPADVKPGQYSLAVRDVTARLAVRERLPTVYVPVDVLPKEVF